MASAGKGRLAWFEFYPEDFLTGVADLSLEEVGLYIKLLAYQWAKGAVKTDADRMARVAGVDSDTYQRLFAGIADKFTETPEGLVNERLADMRTATKGKIEKRLSSLKGGPNGSTERDPQTDAPNGSTKRESQTDAPNGSTKRESHTDTPNGTQTRARARWFWFWFWF